MSNCPRPFVGPTHRGAAGIRDDGPSRAPAAPAPAR
jgi:hypothetical protein